jgi:hypothetical protein
MVWLWDAGRARGITDDEDRAREAAAGFIRRGRATGARVEMAVMASGPRSLNPGYTRLGCGWTARARRDGQVRWAPFAEQAG